MFYLIAKTWVWKCVGFLPTTFRQFSQLSNVFYSCENKKLICNCPRNYSLLRVNWASFDYPYEMCPESLFFSMYRQLWKHLQCSLIYVTWYIYIYARGIFTKIKCCVSSSPWQTRHSRAFFTDGKKYLWVSWELELWKCLFRWTRSAVVY